MLDVDGAAAEVSDMSSVFASVDEFGVLATGNELGMTTLVVTSREENDVNQTLALAVKVEPVAYLMLTSETVLHTKRSRHLVSIPVGTTLTLKMTFHNDVGKQFFATDAQVDYRPGR